MSSIGGNPDGFSGENEVGLGNFDLNRPVSGVSGFWSVTAEIGVPSVVGELWESEKGFDEDNDGFQKINHEIPVNQPVTGISGSCSVMPEIGIPNMVAGELGESEEKGIDEESEGFTTPNPEIPVNSCSETAAAIESEQSEKGIDEDNDGFKTPNRNIPTPTECPPAPRKPHRKSNTPERKTCRRCLRFELDTAEVESIFRPTHDNVQEPETKRARRDDVVLR